TARFLRRGLSGGASGRASGVARGRRDRRRRAVAAVPRGHLAAARAVVDDQHGRPADLGLQDVRLRQGDHQRRPGFRCHRDDRVRRAADRLRLQPRRIRVRDGRGDAGDRGRADHRGAELPAAAGGGPVSVAAYPRRSWVRPVVALVVSALFFVPLYLVLANVIKQGDLIAKEPAALPVPPTLANIHAVLTRPDGLFWVSLTNSMVVTLLSIL